MQEVDVADDVVLEKYDQEARFEQWRDSMLEERTALKNRSCWRGSNTQKRQVDLIEMRVQDK